MAKVYALGIVTVVVLLSGLIASGAPLAASAPGQGDLVRGRVIFEQVSIHDTPGCITCHSLEAGVTVVGPSLAGVGTKAEVLLDSPGYKGLAATPEEVFREAILARDCKLWGEGNRHAIIPEWDGVFERQELLDLTAFLASLK